MSTRRSDGGGIPEPLAAAPEAGSEARMTRPIELVIFDCDGVLVDSERLAVRVDVRVLAELGWVLSEQEVIDRFLGRSHEFFVAEV